MEASPRRCANHEERSAAAPCRKCKAWFCDACLVFDVNGDRWCEVCGNALVEETTPRWGLGAALLAGLWGALTLFWVVILVGLGRIYPVPVVLGYVATLLFVWNRVLPLKGTERPRIVRR